jgi:Transposase IS116/IS110/IS902 family
VIRGLQGFRGIGLLSAVTIAAEAGDLRRFPTAPHFMAYTGPYPPARPFHRDQGADPASTKRGGC